MSDENGSYEDQFKFCARFDTWRLRTACILITGGLPEYVGKDHPEPEFFKAIYEAALSCAGESLPLYKTDVPEGEYRVRPGAFIQWASGFGFALAPPSKEFWNEVEQSSKWESAEELKELKKLFLTATGHKLPQNIASKLRDYDEKCQSKWRCRALAEYFWSHKPELTKVDIAAMPEIIGIGCKGQRVKARQIGEWIADLNPRPDAGRPKKRE